MSKGDLQSYLESHFITYLTEDELRKHLGQMAKCVDAVHKAGYLHNDLMPWNFCLN